MADWLKSLGCAEYSARNTAAPPPPRAILQKAFISQSVMRRWRNCFDAALQPDLPRRPVRSHGDQSDQRSWARLSGAQLVLLGCGSDTTGQLSSAWHRAGLCFRGRKKERLRNANRNEHLWGILSASWSWDLLSFKGRRLAVVGAWGGLEVGGCGRLAVGGWRLVVPGVCP